MDGINLCRGQVVVVSLEPTKGREQKGTRPCVIVQNAVGNKNREVTIIVPLTADRGKKIWPFMAKVPKGEGGLKKNSIALCSQIRVVDMERVEWAASTRPLSARLLFRSSIRYKIFDNDTVAFYPRGVGLVRVPPVIE